MNAETAPGGAASEWKTSRLAGLIWPLIVDQILIVLVGIVDTVMVASLGENAVGGVSLVDSVNVLIIEVFAALTTGGAVVCSQYLGRRDTENASGAAKQLIAAAALLSLFLGSVMFLLRSPLLRLIYGHIERGIMREAETYFFYTIISYPFLALSAAGAAVFRSMGNSRAGMWTSFLINILNFGGNALFIHVFRWGVAGAAIATLISRFTAAFTLLFLLGRSRGPVTLRGIRNFRFVPGMIGSIVRVALPNGAEGASFQTGKLALARLVSRFGTAAIAGNALGGIFMTLGNLPGMATGQALLTVVGQCMGAGDLDGARRYTRRLIVFCYAAMGVFNGLILVSMPLVFGFFGETLSPEVLAYGRLFGTIFCAAAIVIWIPAYCLPNALRAAGDGKYTLMVSTAAMWLARVGLAYLLSFAFGVGAVSVWISMVAEWVVRSAGYMSRWRSGRWKEKRVI